MEFIRHAEKSIALLTPEDLSGDESLAGLIDRALAQAALFYPARRYRKARALC